MTHPRWQRLLLLPKSPVHDGVHKSTVDDGGPRCDGENTPTSGRSTMVVVDDDAGRLVHDELWFLLQTCYEGVHVLTRESSLREHTFKKLPYRHSNSQIFRLALLHLHS